MPYSHYHNGVYHTHRRRRRYGRHYWVGQRRRGTWATTLLIILLAVIAVGGVVYFVRPDIVSNVAQGVAEDAAKREKELEAERTRTLTLPEREAATPVNVKREQPDVSPVLTPDIITNAAQEAAEDAAKRDAEREAEKARTVEPLERASATPSAVKQEPLGVGPVLTPDITTNDAQKAAQDPVKRDEERAEREVEKVSKLALLEREVATLSNTEREQHGRSPLRWESALADIARSHSKDMAANSYFEHRNKQGENATQRGVKAGYRCVKATSIGLGENISFTSSGYFTPKDTVQRWMNSPGHRVNMLDPLYDRVGVGIHYGWSSNLGRGYFVTMVFC